MSENVRLTNKQAQAVNALLSGETVSGAAGHAGVNERTIYRWLDDDAFSDELRRLKAEMLRLAGLRLAGLTGQALQVMSDILNSTPQKGDVVKLRTAIAVLELVDRWRNSDDFDERLSRLESQVESQVMNR